MLIDCLRHGEPPWLAVCAVVWIDELTAAGWQQMREALRRLLGPCRRMQFTRCGAAALCLRAGRATGLACQAWSRAWLSCILADLEGQYPADLMREHADTLAFLLA